MYTGLCFPSPLSDPPHFLKQISLCFAILCLINKLKSKQTTTKAKSKKSPRITETERERTKLKWKYTNIRPMRLRNYQQINLGQKVYNIYSAFILCWLFTVRHGAYPKCDQNTLSDPISKIKVSFSIAFFSWLELRSFVGVSISSLRYSVAWNFMIKSLSCGHSICEFICKSFSLCLEEIFLKSSTTLSLTTF